MGVIFSRTLNAAASHLYANYKQLPIVFDRGLGARLFDTTGKSYLDFTAGIAVTALGHAHPAMVRAVSEQAAKLWHVSNYYFNAPNLMLADKLCAISGYDHALFCNSGSEANEAMLKLARGHFYRSGQPERTRIIAFDKAFHGRTMGSLSMTGTPKYREGFGQLAGITHVPFGDLNAVAQQLGPQVAAVIVEPIQGEGGVLPATAEFLQGLRALCTEHGALLLVDCVQTGIGRTGTWFGFEHADIQPDAISLAKGLGGGFPIGAMLTSASLGGALPAGTHGTTFGGNALGCAVASAVLHIIELEDLMRNAVLMGVRLSTGLRGLCTEFPRVCTGSRGQGLLQAVILRAGLAPREVVVQLAAHGLLCTASGDDALRFTPPLNITNTEIDEALLILRKVLPTLSTAHA